MDSDSSQQGKSAVIKTSTRQVCDEFLKKSKNNFQKFEFKISFWLVIHVIYFIILNLCLFEI